MNEHDKRLSKWMSYVLRHAPHTLGLNLDEAGWTDLETLVLEMQKRDTDITLERVVAIVRDDAKRRYAIADGKIRANQGHSVNSVVPVLHPSTPPTVLYHGTSTSNWQRIQQSAAIRKMARHHVHLSATHAVAQQVGRRHGNVVVLRVDAAAMHASGYLFYVSDNDVWLTEEVPGSFLNVLRAE